MHHKRPCSLGGGAVCLTHWYKKNLASHLGSPLCGSCFLALRPQHRMMQSPHDRGRLVPPCLRIDVPQPPANPRLFQIPQRHHVRTRNSRKKLTDSSTTFVARSMSAQTARPGSANNATIVIALAATIPALTDSSSAPVVAAAARLPSLSLPTPSETLLPPSPRALSIHPSPCTSTPARYPWDTALFPETL
jgi:hypothetical protein